jgi:diguanylate cyclase (GGDEF)-like protein
MNYPARTPAPPATTAAALAAVRRLSFATLDAMDADAIFRGLARELLDVFGVHQVHVLRVADDGERSHGIGFVARGDEVVTEAEYVIPFSRPSGTHRVVVTGAPLNVPDARTSTLVSRELVERFDAASLLLVPLAFDGAVRGVVVLLSRSPRHFADDEVELAYTMANQASAGLSVLDMRERLSRRADREAGLVRAAAALSESLEVRTVLDTLCREADFALGGDVTGFYLADPGGPGRAIAGHGIPKDSDWWGLQVTPGQGMAGRVLATGEPAVSNAYQRDGAIPGADVLAKVQTAVGVPVRWNGELKGALSVGFTSMRLIPDEDIETLQAIADLAAVACRNAEAFEDARAAARTDSLTGLLNHGALHVRLREEIWRARRSGEPLACLMADLDNFKPINDRHGHLIGDDILRRVATALVAEFRPYDTLARYGGDEFVLVLPGLAEDGAEHAGERVRSAIETAAAASGDPSLALTVSVGVACWGEPLTAGELLDRADRALLLAKRRGRGAVVMSNSETDRELSELEGGGHPSPLLAGLWDEVSRNERPADLLRALPALLHRELELQEAAVYEPSPGAGGLTLVRVAAARAPGDPAPCAFRDPSLPAAGAVGHRLSSGPLARESLAALLDALGLPESAEAAEGAAAGSCAAIGLVAGERLHGVLFLRHAAPRFPQAPLRLASTVAGQAALVLLGRSGAGSRTAVTALAAAIDARDNYTASHSEDVVGLACDVARRLGLPPEEVERICDGAMLHDVGKVAIPNEILYKPGPLSPAEWEVMRTHPLIGERILLRTPELAPIAPLVRHEHERWDGRGYPDGLSGEAIPIGSRIILCCDAYNAMITARPYREPMSHEEALRELEHGAGAQFDPRVVEALLRVLALREPVYSAAASPGATAPDS